MVAIQTRNRLGVRFFSRDTVTVARELIGATFVRILLGGNPLLAMIVETEAYVSGDPANHAARGPTRRNWSMFTGPGHLYIYQIHQVHCANITTQPGEAVLLRAAEPISPGLASMRGPGLLSRTLSLTRENDGEDLTLSDEFQVYSAAGFRGEVGSTPRIGVNSWKREPLRFIALGSASLSRPASARRS